ncbi:MAG: hypothetical protein NC097_07275 [Clostridium sp.]|nr:hypothetical protein [Prevotella sp.]MCM1429578.1 hypothetical protein [Clostridium sp.]MCM1476015.1 hypothetical protein [Muribaculaceae bacterium]
MAIYKSKDVHILHSAESVFRKLSNLESFASMLANIPEDQLPADKREQLSQIHVTPDSLELPAGPVGSITLRLTDLVEPTLIRLKGEGSPIPLSVSLEIKPLGAEECEARVVIDIDIPMMLKPMVSGPLNKMTEQFAQMIAIIPYD